MKSAFFVFTIFVVALIKSSGLSYETIFQPEKMPLTAGALINKRLDYIDSLFQGLNFDCEVGHPEYEEACKRLGLKLYFEVKHPEKWGHYISKESITMFVSPCFIQANYIFFHEVGHHMQNHLGNSELNEIEADYFSSMMNLRLGLPANEDRLTQFHAK